MQTPNETAFADSSAPIGLTADEFTESREFLDADLEVVEEPVSSSDVYADDPVRLYLREMGSASLLTRQGEVNLARRIERGKLRVRKVLSRAPLVQQTVMSLYEDIRQEKKKLDHLVELGGPDEPAKERARAAAMEGFERIRTLHDDCAALAHKLESTSRRSVHVRAKLKGRLARANVKLSRAIREVPFFFDAVDDLRRSS